VLRLSNPTREYPWGSPTAIFDLLGEDPTGEPAAELWLGAHPAAPSVVETTDGEQRLDELIARDAESVLGRDVVARFGRTLPYLLKVIAVARPLSLQVHPSLERAREGFAAEEAAGIDLMDRRRSYKDRNHKPELVHALTRFEGLCGFRAPRRVVELLADLDAPLAQAIHHLLAGDPTAQGIRTAFRRLLEPELRPAPEEVGEVVEACRRRLAAGASPSPRADRTVVLLGEAYPGDPGVVTSLLLNPVTLEPGEAMFVPSGGVHAYLDGTAVEVMANSDNVLRAGLTTKHIDVPELLANVDYVAAPPIRIAPEVVNEVTRVYYAPVDDFELSVTEVPAGGAHPLPGRGPRIVFCLEGEVRITAETDDSIDLARGQSAFVPASDGALTIEGIGADGAGRVVQADVP
jgi:mannose-6-phosphate isomerase